MANANGNSWEASFDGLTFSGTRKSGKGTDYLEIFSGKQVDYLTDPNGRAVNGAQLLEFLKTHAKVTCGWDRELRSFVQNNANKTRMSQGYIPTVTPLFVLNDKLPVKDGIIVGTDVRRDSLPAEWNNTLIVASCRREVSQPGMVKSSSKGMIIGDQLFTESLSLADAMHLRDWAVTARYIADGVGVGAADLTSMVQLNDTQINYALRNPKN